MVHTSLDLPARATGAIDLQRTRGGFTRTAIEVILKTQFGARGFGGRHASTMSPRQLKEVIQVAHTNVGSVASLGALVGGEVHR